jgi:hypothetical protein
MSSSDVTTPTGPVSWATEPAVFYAEAAETKVPPADRVVVDLECLAAKLIVAGVPAVNLRSLAVVFHHSTDLAPGQKNQLGWYDESKPYLREQEVSGETRVIGYRCVLHVVHRPGRLRSMSYVLWHEAGHMVRHETGAYPVDSLLFYRRPELVHRTRLVGGGLSLGLLGAWLWLFFGVPAPGFWLVVAIALALMALFHAGFWPQATLWVIEPEEWHARFFSWRHWRKQLMHRL